MIKKKEITTDTGETVQATCPVIVSASRCTDIPAFYADWFFDRLKKGYSVWKNPYNNDQKSHICYDDTRFIVFWSKNPVNLIPHLPYLKERGIGTYIQYTLNGYGPELEHNVPPVDERIDTFRRLVGELGFGHVIWRFDPLILTDKIGIDDLIDKIAYIGDHLKGYTEKLVFSFADIAAYRKVRSNLENSHISYKEWTTDKMIEFGKRLVALNQERGWDYQLATCAERITLDGIEHNHCIDERLIIRLAHDDAALMDYMDVKICPMPEADLFGDMPVLPERALVLDNGTYALYGYTKDKGQRELCGCMKSRDIGQYNTCPHLCEYCYANSDKQSAFENYKKHDRNSESLI